MVDRFQDMFRKVLTGEYQALYPSDFHTALTHVHSIFGDHKQVTNIFDVCILICAFKPWLSVKTIKGPMDFIMRSFCLRSKLHPCSIPD